MPEEMWDIESKRHNKELELWEYWRYFEDLEGELREAQRRASRGVVIVPHIGVGESIW